MTDKILFWLDNYLTYFGIAKSLQETYDFESFAIIEIPERPKVLVVIKGTNYFKVVVASFYEDILVDPDFQTIHTISR